MMEEEGEAVADTEEALEENEGEQMEAWEGSKRH